MPTTSTPWVFFFNWCHLATRCTLTQGFVKSAPNALKTFSSYQHIWWIALVWMTTDLYSRKKVITPNFLQWLSNCAKNPQSETCFLPFSSIPPLPDKTKRTNHQFLKPGLADTILSWSWGFIVQIAIIFGLSYRIAAYCTWVHARLAQTNSIRAPRPQTTFTLDPARKKKIQDLTLWTSELWRSKWKLSFWIKRKSTVFSPLVSSRPHCWW